MHTQSKIAVAVLALAIAGFPILAQTMRQGPPPPDESQGQMQGPGGFGQRGPMGQVGPGGWGGQRGRMGMRGGRGMGPREMGLGRLLSDPNVRQQLGVTTEQVAKIRQQESDFRKTEIRNRADLEIKRMDLNDLLSADKPDRSAIDSKLQEISAAQLAMEKASIDNRLDMRDALTPAQRQKLQQMMMQRGQRGPSPGGNNGGNTAPRGPRGAGRGGPGRPPAPPNAQGQTPPNQ
jgi:Spy/CpxP family protein refolding chaperone